MEETFLNRTIVIIPCPHEWTVKLGDVRICIDCGEPVEELDCSHDTLEASLTDAGYGPSGPY